jgi:hypothetical protein
LAGTISALVHVSKSASTTTVVPEIAAARITVSDAVATSPEILLSPEVALIAAAILAQILVALPQVLI